MAMSNNNTFQLDKENISLLSNCGTRTAPVLTMALSSSTTPNMTTRRKKRDSPRSSHKLVLRGPCYNRTLDYEVLGMFAPRRRQDCNITGTSNVLAMR